jgi:type IV pilus assembly protein PilQ
MKSLTTKSHGWFLLAASVLACGCCLSALAQEGDSQQTGGKKVPSDLDQRMQKIVSIDANDEPIGLVIQQLADQVGVDFIISPQVTGNVTVSLTDVTLKEALQSILAVNGAAYIAGENVIQVVPREELPAISERLVTQTFEIIYADVEAVVEALEKFKSPQGSVSFIQGTSYIIVTDTENKIKQVADLLSKIDRVTPQVLVEVRIYDITSKDNFDLGVEWNAGRRTNYDSLGNIINDDITVSRDGSPTYLDSRTDPALSSGFEGATNKTADATLGFLRFGVLNEHVNIDAQLRAEKEDIDAKLLANPRILVLDNETALFDIVTEHPYVERTITSGSVTENVQFKNVGVKLEVTPHVARDGMLRLDIAPEFGVVVGQVTVSSSDVPIVDTRKVNTVALVRDAQTVVLGGLRKKDATQQINKIPVLGDLPLLGLLFRFKGEATVTTELVVFITPHIVVEPVMSDDEQTAYNSTHIKGPTPVVTQAEKEDMK